MPIYTYRCKKCEAEVEQYRSYSQTPIPEGMRCSCGGELYVALDIVPIHYKGPGFYTTEQRGITGIKRKPNIKVGTTSPDEE